MAKKTNCIVNGVPKYRYRPDDPECDQKNFYGDSRKDAIERYEAYMDSLRWRKTGVFIELFNDWLEIEKRPGLKIASYNRYLSLKSNWIDNAPYSQMPIAEVDSLIIKKHLNHVESEGSRNTAHSIYILLSSFFKYATDYFIDRNPLNRVSMPKRSPKKVKEYLLPEDISIIESKFTSPDQFIYIFALYTGMRQGEIAALRVKDVDLKNKVIRINKTLNRLKIDGTNQLYEGTPKSAAGFREIPIMESLVPLITKHIFSEKTKYSARGLHHGPESYFFSTVTGKPIRGDRLNDSWKKLQAEIGIEPIKFHGLRHTYCTLLARTGVRLEVAAQIMGHESIETTSKIYVHIQSEDKKEAVDAINAISFSDVMTK